MNYTLSSEVSFGDTRLAILDTFRKWSTDLGLWDARKMLPDIEVNSRKYDQQFFTEVELRRVTVRWVHPKEGEKVVSCAKFPRIRDNARAIYLTIESIRMGEKRVGADVYATLVRQVVGLIEGPKGQRDPYEVLGLRPDATLEMVESMYKTLANVRHPDKGGSTAAFSELTNARDVLKKRLGGAA